jgi:hypothetical protein
MADESQAGAEPVRSGWFRSPAGVLTHADGPSQVASYTARGYEKVDDTKAVQEVGDGVQAVEREKRSAAARRGAETRRRNADAQQATEQPSEGDNTPKD